MFGHRKTLRQLRKGKGLRQRDVADSIGISQQLYSDLEVGVKTSVTHDQLVKIAALFGCTADDIQWAINRREQR